MSKKRMRYPYYSFLLASIFFSFMKMKARQMCLISLETCGTPLLRQGFCYCHDWGRDDESHHLFRPQRWREPSAILQGKRVPGLNSHVWSWVRLDGNLPIKVGHYDDCFQKDWWSGQGAVQVRRWEAEESNHRPKVVEGEFCGEYFWVLWKYYYSLPRYCIVKLRDQLRTILANSWALLKALI